MLWSCWEEPRTNKLQRVRKAMKGIAWTSWKNIATILIVFGMPLFCLSCAILPIENYTFCESLLVMLMMLSFEDCQKSRKVNDRLKSCWEEPLMDWTTGSRVTQRQEKWSGESGCFKKKAKYLGNLGVTKDKSTLELPKPLWRYHVFVCGIEYDDIGLPSIFDRI